jgi:hypothetical protein
VVIRLIVISINSAWLVFPGGDEVSNVLGVV